MTLSSSQSEGCSFVLIPPLVATAILIFIGLIATTGTSSPQPAGALPFFFSPEVRRWEGDILSWAADYDLPPELVAVVMQIESCGNPLAVSPSGARGLFQVMPHHFAEGENPFDPQTNARRGLAYLRRSWQAANQDPALALAAYNGGLGVIAQPQSDWPEETQRYVYWGAQIYADARAGRARSPRLEEWLRRDGGYLCRETEP